MPTSKTLPYDVIIVGAGINGCTCAYFLSQAGLKVALVDQTGIASGGSGAAGAFISPKISKEGPLKKLMEVAHTEALQFYKTTLASCTLSKPLLHIGKTEEDTHTIKQYKKETSLAHGVLNENFASRLTDEARRNESIYFDEGAVVDAIRACNTLAQEVDVYTLDVVSPLFEEGVWKCGNLQGAHMLLAIGAYPKLVPIPYLTLRGIWGHRIDLETSTDIPSILHHHVSISPTTKNGVVAIGATHNVHYSPFGEGDAYDVQAGRAELLEKAGKTLKLDNIKILKDYMGLRSGSNDYLPMLGPIVDAEATIRLHPQLQHGKAVDPAEYVYYPNLTMINGSGGYGFVLAPYLAKRLKEYLAEGVALDETITPSRFFTRWVKRMQ